MTPVSSPSIAELGPTPNKLHVPAGGDDRPASNHGAKQHTVGSLLLAAPAPVDRELEARLLKARLGVAVSLFTALRCKHAETAAHSVRVAIMCSVWARHQKLPAEERDALEVAALLHDIGKVGLPDRILLKATKLTEEEQAIVDRHRLMGVEILSGCCGSLKVLEIVSNAPAWFNGRRMRLDADGDALPLGARMLAVADAYDSMTASQVYRPARSHERALAELFEWSGNQFDPALVHEFAALHRAQASNWTTAVSDHWLFHLDPITIDLQWQFHQNFARRDDQTPRHLFEQRLLENMYDAVIFVDANRQIMLWNRGAERLTGIDSSIAYQRVFDPSFVQLRNERGDPCADDDCPVNTVLRTGMQSAARFLLNGRDGRDTMVEVQTIPVVGDHGMIHGVSIVLHDASGQVSLEERCLNLQQKATRDPLTQLSNRAEFDRALALFVNVHLERRLPCSLIIADIDRFKQVNDSYGHQAGDEAIKSFAQLFKAQAKPGDLAARYGGEEFVLLCAGINNAAAAERAEEMRKRFGELMQPALSGGRITASFGVTELQPGDSPDTMLRRADRALLMAKDSGRNRVIQLGDGIGDSKPERRKKSWWPWQTTPVAFDLQHTWFTTVPLSVVAEKLRGFIVDHYAEIVSTSADGITLEVVERNGNRRRRQADRAVPVMVQLTFFEEHVAETDEDNDRWRKRTRIEANIGPKVSRDRRKSAFVEPAMRLATSLKAYLMVSEHDRGEVSLPPASSSVPAQWQGRLEGEGRA